MGQNTKSEHKSSNGSLPLKDTAQFRPLIHQQQYSFSSADETADHCRSFATFNKRYSMGVNGVTEAQSPAGANGTLPAVLNARCCCGLLRIQVGAILIAAFELAFFLYQIFVTTVAYDKTGDEYALAFTLTLFSFVLAMIAVVLLLIGVHRRSPYFLVPHLLMQFAILCSTFLLAIYLTLLLIGGTSVKLDAIFYEDSPRGELGLAQSSQLTPIRATIVAKGINKILILLLFLTSVCFAVQFWFFVVVRRCYQLYRHGILEKPSLNGTAASVVLNNSDRSSKMGA